MGATKKMCTFSLKIENCANRLFEQFSLWSILVKSINYVRDVLCIFPHLPQSHQSDKFFQNLALG